MKKAIIDTFCDAPDTWTDADFEALRSATGINVTREELRTARRIKENNTLKLTEQAIQEGIASARGEDFNKRLRLLVEEILPAVDFKNEQKKRLSEEK